MNSITQLSTFDIDEIKESDNKENSDDENKEQKDDNDTENVITEEIENKNKNESENSNDKKQQEKQDEKQEISVSNNELGNIENAMTNQIELQNIKPTPQENGTPITHDTEMKQLDELWISAAQTQDFNTDAAESSISDNSEDDGKYSQSLAEDSEARRDAESVLLKDVEREFKKYRDEYLNVLCHSCECDMNDLQFVRYECDDKNCYKRKYKDYHIQYCLQCWKQLNSIIFMKKYDKEIIFRDDGFEVRTETDKVEGEPSITDTDTNTNTNTQTQPSQESDTETSPPPYGRKTNASSKDFYKFQVKLKRMVIDHCDKTLLKDRKTKGNVEEEKKIETNVMNPLKAVVCYPSDDADPDRVVYISCELNHLSISERWETGNADCDIQMTVKLYWMLSESDYIKYNTLKRKNKKRNLAFNDNELQFSFKPVINFYRAVRSKEPQAQQHIHLIDMKSFFGDTILKNVHFMRESPRKKDAPWDNIRRLMFGYMAEVTYYCEVLVFEPFEIENFPYDCQDIPIVIEPNNFHTLAPAYFGKKNSSFLTITGDATNLGRWSMENTITEFNNKLTSDKTNTLRIMLKLKRHSSPYMLEHVFLIAAVCFISLTAFTIDSIGDEVKHERLAIVLGLILTLIFIDLPAVPNVTLLHWYFYASFAFLVLQAIHFAGETYYSPIILRIEGSDCYGNDDDDDWSQCKWYQKNNYNSLWFILFGVVYVIYHITFILVSVSVNAEENKKLQMDSIQVKKNVEDENWKILTPSIFRADASKRRKTYLRYEHTDLFCGYRYEQDDDGTVDQAKNVIMQRHREFNRSKSQMSEIMERLSVLGLVTVLFVILPAMASILQFLLLRAENCVPETNKVKINENEHLVMIILSGVQSIVCLLWVLFWFNCCAGACVQSLFLYSIPITGCVIIANYVLCIRSFVLYFYDQVNCDTSENHNTWLQHLLYWLFLTWIVAYACIFGLIYLKFAFPKTFVEKRGFDGSKDAQVEMLKFFKQKMKNDIKPRYQYFNIKIFTTTMPIIIQYPATIILFLLIRNDSCNYGNDPIMSVGSCIALISLSLIFHFIRAGLQGNNCFFYYFTFYMCGNITITILAIHGFVFADKYWDNNQCKKSNLYSILWYFMFLWILYDCMSIFGILFEFLLNYKRINFDLIPFLSVIIMCSIIVFQLPVCIGQLYVVLKYDNVNSTMELTVNDTISYIIIIYIQILIYGIMQTKKLRDFTIYPMYLLQFIVYIASIRSFVFWITVDNTTVASILFSIIFALSILYDTFLLVAPTFALPAAAWAFYGGISSKNGMFRAMLTTSIIFTFIQVPACLMNLVPIWRGKVETISAIEGETLLLLSWITLLIGYIYTYIYFDNDPKIRSKTHPKFELEPFKVYVKYLLYSVSLVVWTIIIHCFSFWSRHNFGGLQWWFFLVWIIIYVISSISPSIRFIYIMFCKQSDITRWINNIYVGFTIFAYVFVQLPASIIQLAMIEFQRCQDFIDHTLDDSTIESFFILIFTLIQLILFYAICDIIGWDDEQDEINKFETQSKYIDKQIEKRVTSNYDFKRYNTDWVDLGFKTKDDYIKAVRNKKKQLLIMKRKKQFKRFNGPIFYVVFIIVCIIQFGLAIHSFTYWDKSDKQIDCTNDTITKTILYYLFLFWIIIYSAAPIVVFGSFVLRAGLKKGKQFHEKRKIKKRQRANIQNNNENKSNGNNNRAKHNLNDEPQEQIYHV